MRKFFSTSSAAEDHRKSEFAAIKFIQAENGITIHGDWTSYKNRDSQLVRSCDKCGGCTTKVKAGKAKLGQECRERWRLKANQNQKLQDQEIEKMVRDAGFEVIGGLDVYKSGKSKITVRHLETGTVTTRPVDDFRPARLFHLASGCMEGRNVGETLMVSILHFVLGVHEPIESVFQLTPPHLQNCGIKLRHDGFFENVKGHKVAVEHQGNYHKDPTDPIFLKSKLKFPDVVKRDELKRELCGDKVVLIEVDDLARDFNKTGLVPAANHVVASAQSKLPQVFVEAEVQARIKQLQDDNFIIDLLLRAGVNMSPMTRLLSQLRDENSDIEVLEYNPVTSVFRLRCDNPRHPRHEWLPHSNNALGSTRTGRKGTRCRLCANLKIGEVKKLPNSEVMERAKAAGFLLISSPDAYGGNTTDLIWQGIHCGHPPFVKNWAHLFRDGCTTCKKQAKERANAEIEIPAIRSKVESNGDLLVSCASEYRNQKTKLKILCQRPGGCGAEFEMAGNKIKAGQLHSCDKHARAAATRARNLGEKSE
jgi:hypothetical protein